LNEKTRMAELDGDRREGKVAAGKVVYIISRPWLDAWKNFVSGGPRPDRIDNSHLFRGDLKTLRDGLQPIVDYRGLSAREWSTFYDWYGGGPAVRRETLDIYSKPVQPKVSHLSLSERTQLVKAQKQKLENKPIRVGDESRKEADEIDKTMVSMARAPLFPAIKDPSYLRRLPGFNSNLYAELVSQHQAKIESRELDEKDDQRIALEKENKAKLGGAGNEMEMDVFTKEKNEKEDVNQGGPTSSDVGSGNVKNSEEISNEDD